ncbi:MAG: hypothetical protein HW411_1345 [Gammaproteobacteria bacterium]|nr:hypothetical protein [Gammaproteobacteria bacterium]
MKRITLALLIILSFADIYAGEIILKPKFTPEDAQKKIESFILSKDIEFNKYKLSSLSFDYIKGRWVAFYEYKECPCPVGAHFGVILNNEEPYEFELEPGL